MSGTNRAHALRSVFWIGVYVGLAVSPLAAADLEQGAHSRSWLTEFSAAVFASLRS